MLLSHIFTPLFAPDFLPILSLQNPNCEYNTLDDNFTKQAVGLMVKTILEPFGYSVWKQKDLPRNSRAEKFQTASVYRRDMTKTATLRVKKTIEEI